MITEISIPSHYSCLVVEDSETRNEWFREFLPNAVIADNPTDALTILHGSMNIEFDIVFLDHDCHGLVFVDKSDPEYLNHTFWRVAQYLHRIEFKGQIVIHSANPVGAKRMADLLSPVCKVFVAPFGSFDIQMRG